jgi:hypothetical protein
MAVFISTAAFSVPPLLLDAVVQVAAFLVLAGISSMYVAGAFNT